MFPEIIVFGYMIEISFKVQKLNMLFKYSIIVLIAFNVTLAASHLLKLLNAWHEATIIEISIPSLKQSQTILNFPVERVFFTCDL